MRNKKISVIIVEEHFLDGPIYIALVGKLAGGLSNSAMLKDILLQSYIAICHLNYGDVIKVFPESNFASFKHCRTEPYLLLDGKRIHIIWQNNVLNVKNII